MDRRYAWAGAGAVIVAVAIVVAAPNLQEIYAAQKDFVVGSMLSLAGFAFGKALDRSKQRHEQWLQEEGSYDHLSKLEERMSGAGEKLAEHYWSLSDPSEKLTAAYDDLAKAGIHLDRLRHTLSGRFGEEEWKIPATARLKLDGVRRHLREALKRLEVSRQRMAEIMAEPKFRQAWDVFDVLENDLRQANRNLDPLDREWVVFPPDEQLLKTANYLKAATDRSAEFSALIADARVDPPKTFEIMNGDMAAATMELEEVSFKGAGKLAS